MSRQWVLRDRLISLHQHPYSAYQALQGCHDLGGVTLRIDHVQGDPFAAPSRVRLEVPQEIAQFPAHLWAIPCRETALSDYLTRQFYKATTLLPSSGGSSNSALIQIIRPSQAILSRSVARVNSAGVELRLQVGLPGVGRRIDGHQAATLLTVTLPALVQQTLIYSALDPVALEQHCYTAEDAEVLRSQLAEQGLVAFIADGSILPRRSGVDDRPLEIGVMPFQSPPSMRVCLSCPHAGQVTGMGIAQGVTLVVGGGYHGKSTLLRAIAMGIYNHIPGDGRHQVVTDPTALKIRAEDGRCVTGVDISPFLNHLPQGQSTQYFSTLNASGSTSQAASLIEALEVGTRLLLMDEDTCATNFMIRDRRMQALIDQTVEPITPFLDKVRQVYGDYGVSTILVMGGSGDYFDVADRVIALENFSPREVTHQARQIAVAYPTHRHRQGGSHFGPRRPRRLQWPPPLSPADQRRIKMKVQYPQQLQLGSQVIDLLALEQLVEAGQVRAIAAAMLYAQNHYATDAPSLGLVLNRVMADLYGSGLDCLAAWPQGDLAQFRNLDLAAVLNRWRSLAAISPPL
ncbi:MAG: ATPase [Cyanobacteria bacterium REEB459]|nr:ATPase [Cyanobacteria bacterium REEB459]